VDNDRSRPSLDGIFRPRNVAVVGASERKGSIGHEILANLVDYGFQGPVFPVNPTRRVVRSIKAYARVSDIPERVDLAIIAVPRDGVLPVVEDCAAAGVRGLVVITAGFHESGGEGSTLQQRIVDICRDAEMRLIGPNCMGVINSDPAVRLLGSFAANEPGPGNVAFMSQSGALGEAILAHATEIGVGLSMFASLGNKADTSADDLLEYWDSDPRTEVILAYLESFGSPRRFTRLAREISRRKPIVAVKAGRTARGARAAASHTGALAGADLAIDAMMAQCGVLRASSIDELFDTASVLSTQPLPVGRRLCIVTNAGGPGILATDAAETVGLHVDPLGDETLGKLREALPPQCALGNPIDLIADADAGRYRAALDVLATSSDADMFLLVFVSPVMIDADAVAREFARFAGICGRPVVATIMGKLGADSALSILHEARLPTFVFPESAVRGLTALAQHAEWVRRPPQELRVFEDVDDERVAVLIAAELERGDGEVSPETAAAVLEAYGIPMARSVTVDSAAAAVSVAEEIGWPVVIKVATGGAESSHKSDYGGVRIGIASAAELESAAAELIQLSRDHGGGGRVTVQEMLGRGGGKELILGLKTDPQFGPLVMVGAGGIYVEYTRDVAFRVAPIDEREADEMLRSLRTYPLLEGVRGEPRLVIEAALEALLRLSQLASRHPEIAELDVNPFILTPEMAGSGGVDVRMRLATGARA
jgi:acetyl coenzyme A synthetase (ADP forming)-like protein